MMDRHEKRQIIEVAGGTLAILAIYVLGSLFIHDIIDMLRTIPFFDYLYLAANAEIMKRSLFGLWIVSFFGSLFFIGYPGELFFFVYSATGYSMLYVSIIMLSASLVGQALNYGIGYFIEKKFFHGFVKKKEKHYLKSLRKNGPSFIIILNILPLPSDILSVILGMVRYDFRKAAIYTIIGRLLKFAFLILLIFIMRIYSG